MQDSFNHPLVTVVMPAYNASGFIRESIESVLNQNFNNFELIIIDDCSSDDTFCIATKYQRKDKRVRLYRNRRRLGDARTRNRIVKLSRGKYLAPLDADDLMLQGRLKDHCDFLDNHPKIGVVFGKAIIVDEKIRNIVNAITPRNNTEAPICRSGVIKRLPVGFNHGTAMIRKRHMFKAGLYEDSLPLGVDARLMRRIFLVARFYFLNKFCLIYRQQSQSICRSRLREIRHMMAKIFNPTKRWPPATLTFYINGRWIKVETRNAATAKTLQWRLNFYSLQAQRHAFQEKRRWIDLRGRCEKIGEVDDTGRFRHGFLMPFAAALQRRGKVLLDETGLVSFHGNGILIFAEEDVRSNLILSFLNRDFHYHSSNNPILYAKRGSVFGESLIHPLMISKPIYGTGRHESWGQFWNPILGKYFLNICFYRTYLIGNECRISKMLFIQTKDSARNVRTERLKIEEARTLLHANRNAQLSQWGAETCKILAAMMRQAPAFLIKAPKDKLRKVALDFKI